MRKISFLIFSIFIILFSCQKASNNLEINTILGCIDEDALNYNAEANEDDGTCVYNQTIDCQGVQEGLAREDDCGVCHSSYIDQGMETLADIATYTDTNAIEGILILAGSEEYIAINSEWNATCNVDNASRSELLKNITNNIIIPAHQNLQYEIGNLSTNLMVFTNNTSASNLNELRNAWLKTYLAWQSVEMFAIGKAEEMDYIKTMNTYPCNTTQISNNISSQSYNLNDANYPSWAAQGLPTLDYMLYGLDSDTNLVINYYTGAQKNEHLNYLTDIINQMQINTNLVVDYWNTNKENFINSDGNTATSSLNILTNDFIYYFEKGLRANKIGIPCGVWNGFQTYEIGIEGYYRKNISKQLALEALNSCKYFFIGKGINSGAIGASYANILAQNSDSNLSTDIINGLNEAKSAINNLNNNFRQQLIEDNTSMLNTYDELQDVVVLLKVDLLFFLEITVDYADSDGD